MCAHVCVQCGRNFLQLCENLAKMAKGGQSDQMKFVTDLFYYKYGTFSLQLFVINKSIRNKS